jgi:hypothetical protein
MGMHWLECVIAIDGKVEWNTFVLSVTINHFAYFETKKKQTPWPLFRKRTIPTERTPLVGEI